jgi:hypothetical protein
VENPGWAYPRALLVCIVCIMVSYILPIFIGATATDFPYDQWADGFFAKVTAREGADPAAPTSLPCILRSNRPRG